MKAIIWSKYGSPDGLHLQDVAKPTPKANELLIKVHATTVTAGDAEMRSLKFPFWLKIPIRLFMGVMQPRNKIMGQELAGEVEAVGQDVTQFRPGDRIFAATGITLGAYAEYICLPERSQDSAVAVKPATMTYAQAAAVPIAGFEALHFLRKANIQRGEKVLVFGGGGSIGTYGIQLARYFGAEVTGLDSAAKLDTMRSIGADHVIDYAQEDFSASGETYDVIFDVIGRSSFSACIRTLKPNGRYVRANPGLSDMLRAPLVPLTSSKRVILGSAKHDPEDLAYLKELIEAGNLTAVVDRSFPLAQAAEAHRYVDSGQKKGNVVITVISDD
ncbi:MAG: NAD(P)-dependent alcohol dehydrogenase [Anaerolineae bacterium]